MYMAGKFGLCFMSMASTTLHIKIDIEEKRQLQEAAVDMGLTLSSFVLAAARQAARTGKLTLRRQDPFYSERNQARLDAAFARLEAGQGVPKTMAELEAMENA